MYEVQRLADDHGTTVAYLTLRTYVTSRRAARQVPASELTRAGRWPCRQEALPSAACTP
jgi:hypothetical protein